MLYAKTAWWLPDDDAVARRDATLAAIAAGAVGAVGAADAVAGEGDRVGGERVRCRVYSVTHGHSVGAASSRVSGGSE